jgi:uncharacterized cupin superfamily protein
VSANFSKTNLRRDVENSADAFGLPDTFEARFAKGAMDAKDLGVSLQKLAPGTTMPFAHRHKEQPEEIYVVVAGSGTITVDDEEHEVAAWDAVHVAGPVARHFSAGDEGLEVLAFGRIGEGTDAEILPLT